MPERNLHASRVACIRVATVMGPASLETEAIRVAPQMAIQNQVTSRLVRMQRWGVARL